MQKIVALLSTVGNFTDPRSGADLVVERKRAGPSSRYVVSLTHCPSALLPGEASDECLGQLLGAIPNLDDLTRPGPWSWTQAARAAQAVREAFVRPVQA